MDEKENVPTVQDSTPDENSGVLVEGLIKIFDPETTEVFVEGRA